MWRLRLPRTKPKFEIMTLKQRIDDVKEIVRANTKAGANIEEIRSALEKEMLTTECSWRKAELESKLRVFDLLRDSGRI